MHPGPSKGLPNSSQTKRKQEKTRNQPSWIFKIPTIYMTSGLQCKGTTNN